MAILQSNGLVLFQRVEPIKITLFFNGSLFGKEHQEQVHGRLWLVVGHC